MQNELRVYVAFSFSEPHEVDLLVAKLNVEAPLVAGWVIVENSFTHKGQPKDVHLRRLFDSDPRLMSFRERVTVVTLDENFRGEFRYSPIQRAKLAAKIAHPRYSSADAHTHYDEMPNFHAEQRQRDAALAPLADVSSGRGWVVVTDVDEFIDCSTGARRDQLVRALRSGAPVVRLRRQRFYFDVDNACPDVRFVGCAAIDHLRDTGRGLQSIRTSQDGLLPTPEPLVFEYSFCIPRSAITRKLQTYAHLVTAEHTVDAALEHNHGFFTSEPREIGLYDWYTRVDLEAIGAPGYVIDNADDLRTGNVNPEYEAARRLRYPHLFR